MRLGRKSKGSETRPWRALILASFIGVLIGFLSIGEPAELAIKMARDNLNEHPASGTIVLVAVDDRTVAELGKSPWTGSRMSSLLDRIRQAEPRLVHVDLELPNNSVGTDAAHVEAALRSFGDRISLSSRVAVDSVTRQRTDYLPPPQYSRVATLANTNLWIDWDGSVRQHPYGAPTGGPPQPSLAARLSTREGGEDGLFPIDFSTDLASIPVLSASDLLAGRVNADALAGKSVIVASTDLSQERFWTPGHGPLPAAMIHALAAETLIAAQPIDLGWLPPLFIGTVLAGLVLFNRRRSVAFCCLGAAFAGATVAPLLLDRAHIYVAVVPGLCVVLIAAGARGLGSLRRSFHTRGTTNLVTGLPNLQALRQEPALHSAILVAARINNYPQITASLQPQHEKEMVEQIVARLGFGTDGSRIYQLDEGVFVWVAGERSEDTVLQQIEALHALFRSPIVVATRLIDLAVTFGLNLDTSRPLLQRVPGALIAADGAAREGKRWASFNAASLKDAEWAMSLLARLDHAIEAEELWVAYQPKLDLSTGRITGAEALARWNHPEKGQIFPDQFIGAAEEGGRIERLTYFVLDHALEAAASINRSRRGFHIAVNLSAQLLTSETLIGNVEALLRKHRLPPQLLTLEVTETSTMGSAEEALANLQRLADLGLQLSIDDYGTGFSTLEYLRRIPASELKIDRSFISMLDKSQSDRIMVNSTIQLAHSLGRKVVAEGVENEEILRELRRMDCDIVQGYHIARPMPLPNLFELLESAEEGRYAA